MKPEQIIIEYEVEGEVYCATLGDIIDQLGWEYGLPDNIMALMGDNLEIKILSVEVKN